VRLLLDTHVLLWALGDPDRLSAAAAAAIRDGANDAVVSAATAWEIALKQSVGKLQLPGPAEEWLLPAVASLRATWLPVTAEHAVAVRALPWHHRDPFDRILVAQAIGAFTLVTHDRRFAPYEVAAIWT
jgi:PIN domain nuclease of toxin-antitoxin system